MSSEIEVLPAVEHIQKHEQKAPQADTLKVRDAQICIVCDIVEKLPVGRGIEAFYCKKCNETFRQKIKFWKRVGLTVTLRPRDGR